MFHRSRCPCFHVGSCPGRRASHRGGQVRHSPPTFITPLETWSDKIRGKCSSTTVNCCPALASVPASDAWKSITTSSNALSSTTISCLGFVSFHVASATAVCSHLTAATTSFFSAVISAAGTAPATRVNRQNILHAITYPSPSTSAHVALSSVSLLVTAAACINAFAAAFSRLRGTPATSITLGTTPQSASVPASENARLHARHGALMVKVRYRCSNPGSTGP